MKRLYELKRGDKIRIMEDLPEPKEIMLTFDHVDGSYSYSTTSDGRVCHLAAYTPLKEVNGHYEIIEDKEDK